MNFIEKIIAGFQAVLSFLGNIFSNVFDFFGDVFQKLFDIIAKPLQLLFDLLEAIFFFFLKLFEIGVMIIKIFTAFFQYVYALGQGIFRTISSWSHISVSKGTSFPSASGQGFNAVIEILQPTGLMTVVPIVATAFLWLFFVIKILGLLGGDISVSPFKSGGGEK